MLGVSVGLNDVPPPPPTIDGLESLKRSPAWKPTDFKMDLARVVDTSHLDDLKSELSFGLGHSFRVNLGSI